MDEGYLNENGSIKTDIKDISSYVKDEMGIDEAWSSEGEFNKWIQSVMSDLKKFGSKGFHNENSEKDTITEGEQPYIRLNVVSTIIKYNPKYGDDRVCECGHTYGRHFDTYDDMEAIGCNIVDAMFL